MNFSHRFPPAIFGAVMVSSAIVMMPLISSVALTADVQQIAREITVRIDGPGAGGSGFIVKREDDIYTVVTNWHVVDREGEYTVKTEDGRAYPVRYSQIQQLPGADLAVMYFTSSQNYRVAELGNSDNISLTQTIYVSGWVNPVSAAIRQPAYSLIQGQITAIQSPNDGGYALVYNTTGNYKGMSGGPVLNQDGKVIGVNGQAVSDPIQGMVGLYLGIPINTFERLQARAPRPVNPSPPQRTESNNIAREIANLLKSQKRWIEIDLTSQRLVAWDGATPVYAIIISTGKDATPTPQGVFAIQSKYEIARMQEGDDDIPDVPFTMYYYGGYAIRGSYWHNNFGTPVTQGSTDVAVNHAEWLFNWASIGTTVVVHD